MSAKLERRVFLTLIGSGTAAAIVPAACTSAKNHIQPGDAEPPSPIDSGAADSEGPQDVADGVSDPSLDAAANRPWLDARPECVDPPAGTAGCSPSPAGRAVGRPCDFDGFRIHAAPHDDEFLAVLVGRDAGGLYARSARCTHMGCNLSEPGTLIPEGVKCPCHGSIFDHLGNVWPDQAAKVDLRPVALALGCDGQLYVDTFTTVDPSFRLDG